MKNNIDEYLSIRDLTDKFHVNRNAIELYGVQGLLPPASAQLSASIYRPVDIVRLKLIIKAQKADYTIGNIRELIGVISLNKDEADQIEESLVYSKKKYTELNEVLEELDILEKINISCDLELLDGYIQDLTTLKYGLPDISHFPIPDIDDELRKTDEKHDVGIANIRTEPTRIERKISWKLLLTVVSILLFGVGGYLYLLDSSLFGTTANTELPAISDTLASNAITPQASETEKGDSPQPIESDLDSAGPALPNDPSSKTELELLSNTPMLKEKIVGQLDDSANEKTQMVSDEQPDTNLTTAELLEAIKQSKTQQTEAKTPGKEGSENFFFKQLAADLQKKYDEQPSLQTTDAAGMDKDISTAEISPETNKNKGVEAATVPGTAPPTGVPPAGKLMAAEGANPSEKKVLKDSDSQKTAPKEKPSLTVSVQTTPKKVAVPVVAQTPTLPDVRPVQSDSGRDVPSVLNPKPLSQPVPSETPNDKLDISTLSVSDKSAEKAVTQPKTKPKIPPPKPTNPEALKWVQKSYESVMRGDAGEAIITASVAITLDSRSVNAYINRSWAYSKKGLYDKAIQDCDKALDIDGENALAYNNRGLAFQGKGDMDRAKADYERACKLGFKIGCNNYQEVVNALASDS